MGVRSDIVEALRSTRIFGDVGDDALLEMAGHSRLEHFETHELIITAGSPQTAIYVIIEGSLHLYRDNSESGSQMLIGILEPPGIVGDAELYSARPWQITARAASSTRLIMIANSSFERAVKRDGRVAARLYRDACQRHLLCIELMQVLALQKRKHIVMRFIGELYDATHKEVLTLSRVRIARAIGSNPKTISRYLKEMEKDGSIQILSRDSIRLLQPAAFEWRRLTGGPGLRWKLPES